MLNLKKLRNDHSFIIISIIVILLILLLSLNIDKSHLYEEIELSNNGENEISKLVINEVMSSNGGVYSDEYGNLDDWIEIYNGTNKDINLKGYMLSDDENKNKWSFPDVIIKENEYLIVNLSGEKKEGLYANFKLSNKGEKLFLRNPKGKVVDALEIPKLKKNEVLLRNLDGNLYVSTEATPGFINTKEGKNNYFNSLISNGDIKLNEILPDNNGNFMNEYNEFPGFIEIINTSDNTINLKNYSLSNDSFVPFKYQLPDMYINPNEVKVIYLDSKDELSTNFKLNNKNGIAILTNNTGKIIDKIEYSNLENGYAIKRQDNDLFETNVISPGYLNNVDGEETFSKNYLKNSNELIINEIMNNNYSYLSQNGNEYYDWIELKNNTNEDINLKDYKIGTGDTKYKLPDKILKPGELYILMASGDSNLTNSYIHIDFKLSDNESLYLYKDNKIIDSMYIANVPLGYSMGRNNSNGYYYFNNPTPLSNNSTGSIDISIAPVFQNISGIYNDVDNLIINLKTGGKTYYTLDGSNPSDKSILYKDKIVLDKTTVVKAVTYEDNKIKSKVASNSYIINENHVLPVLSVSLDNSSLNYINSHPSDTIEVSAYAELYEDDNSFSIPCGLKLFGGSTRYLSKKSYALKFKKKYGISSLNYKVFDNRDFSLYDTLVVRSGSQDYQSTMFRDELMTSLVDGVTNLDVQAYKAIILYMNGNYQGIYYLREKVDDDFISNHYNIKNENINIVRIDGKADAGTNTTYNELLEWIDNHDLSDQKNYEYIKTKINIESFADFWASETYVTNNDIINQRFFQTPNFDNNRWNWIYYDLDYAMYNVGYNYYNFQIQQEGMSDFKVSTFLMRNLIKNKEFKATYLKRIIYILNNVYTKEKVLERINNLYNLLDQEMPRESIKWGNDYFNWKSEVDKLKNYASNRTKYMLSQTKYYFNLTDNEMKEYFGDL